MLTGGVALPSSAFSHVTDAAVLAQLPSAAARAAVLQLDLGAQGLDPGPAVFGGRKCRTYGEGLPEPHGGSMPGLSNGVNSPTGLELFWGSDANRAEPLTLARWPDFDDPRNWSKIVHNNRAPFNRTFVPDTATLQRSANWVTQLKANPGSIYVHEYQVAGWADMFWPVVDIQPSSNMTFGTCGNMSVGEVQLDNGNYFYVLNVLAELSRPGEYYIDRTTKKLYVWPPSFNVSDGCVCVFVCLCVCVCVCVCVSATCFAFFFGCVQ